MCDLNMAVLKEKTEALLASLGNMKHAVVAYSGGVDSTLLAAAAHRALSGRSIAVTVRSPLSTSADRQSVERMMREIGIRHIYLDLDELSDGQFTANDPRKCYYCKKMRFGKLDEWASRNGYEAILDGSNLDDLSDYRPGFDAMKEFGAVQSPLLACGFTKNDVRELSKEWGLETWRKPAGACLASRIALRIPIDRNNLEMVDRAESFLTDMLPPHSQLRVRHYGEIAKIETDEMGMKILCARAGEVNRTLRTIGYRYVTLDLGGYAMGSCNPSDV